MRDLQVGLSHSFEVTFDTGGLFVAMRVFDDSAGSPAQVGSPIPMTVFYGTSYRAKFTPTEEKSYLVHKAVYTDGTYATLHPDYAQGSDSFRAVDFAAFATASAQTKLGTVCPSGEVIEQTLSGEVIS